MFTNPVPVRLPPPSFTAAAPTTGKVDTTEPLNGNVPKICVFAVPPVVAVILRINLTSRSVILYTASSITIELSVMEPFAVAWDA